MYRPTKFSHGPKPTPEEFDFQEKKWSDLMVGDIVKVKNGDVTKQLFLQVSQ